MSGPGKLAIGTVSTIIGFVLGLVAHFAIMERSGDVMFDRPALGLAVALGLCGGGALLLGYASLGLINYIELRRKRTARKAKKRRGK